MLEWKAYKKFPGEYYLGRIFEMHLSHGKVELVDGSDQSFMETLTPEEAKRLLQQAIDLIDKHCRDKRD